MLRINNLIGFGKAGVATPSLTYDYAHALGSGDRTATISVSGNPFTPSGGTLSNAVDGASANNTSDAFNFPLGQSSRVIEFDFGSAVDFNEYTITWSNSIADQGTWRLDSSPDHSTWTQRKANFTMGGTTNEVDTLDSTTSARYWRFVQVAGSTNGSPRWLEITFKMLG